MAIRLLAFDLGAESGRAVLGTLRSGRLQITEVHRFLNTPLERHGHLHWDFPALVANVKTALKRAAAATGDGGLDGLGVDTWGVDYGLLDEAGELIGLPYHYRDARNDGVVPEVLARVGRERLYQRTGIQFHQINTLVQLVAHRRDDPDSLARARTLLFMPDLFTHLLTGVAATEPTIASTSQMYDPTAHAWAEDLLDALDLPRRILPPIKLTGSRTPLRAGIARGCGVADGCPVIATSSHDTAAAVAAVPAVGGNWCYVSSGTWSLMGVELDRPIINDRSLALNYTNEVGFGRSIRFLRNIMGLWLVQECRRELARQGHQYDYAILTRMAAEAPAGGSVVDPDHATFLSPGDMPAKIERFCRESNQTPPADHAQFIRCCLESLALMYRRTLEDLDQLTGRRIDTIHIVGGGSHNELLNQMTADACGRPVVAGPAEATAIGNLLVQAAALGAISSARQIRQIVANSFPRRRYDPGDTGLWDRLYERFREVAQR